MQVRHYLMALLRDNEGWVLCRTVETVKVVLPLGTTLLADDPARQNMVILGPKGRDRGGVGCCAVDEIIHDERGEQGSFFEARRPTMTRGDVVSSSTFSVGGLACGDIIAALSAAQAARAKVAGTQVAVWAVTDKVSPDELRDRFDADDHSIADACAILNTGGLAPRSGRMFAGYMPAL